MGRRNVRPVWWKLYLIVAIGLALMVLDAKAPLSELGHEITECGLLLLIYALVGLWLRASQLGLLQVPRDRIGQHSASELHPVAYVMQAFPSEAVAGGNGDGRHEPTRAIEPLPRQVDGEPR
jgi:hypothetical protein